MTTLHSIHILSELRSADSGLRRVSAEIAEQLYCVKSISDGEDERKNMKLLPLMPEEIAAKDQVGPVLHVCQKRKKPDEVELLIPGTSAINRFKRYVIRRCILSEKHSTTRIHIKSSASIRHEIDRHIKYYPFIIHPFSDARNHWSIFMSIFTFISLILVPFVLTFYFDHQQDYLHLLLFLNIVLSIDMITNFFIGYFDSITRAVILERKVVICKYLQTFFILDFLSGFPFEIIYYIWNSFTFKNQVEWYWTVSNILKIIRIRNLIVSTRQVCHLYKVSFQKSRILEMLIISIICIHWATCLELYIPLVAEKIIGKNLNPRTWLSSHYMQNRDTIFRRYITSANRATIALMSSSHYLHVKTTEDILFNLFLTILGRIGFIYLLAQFLQLMTIFHSTTKGNVRDVQQFHEYMKYKELPHSIRQRLFAYYKYYQKNIDKDKLIIAQVSPKLREELLMHNYKEILAKVEIFKYLPQSMLPQVVMLIKNEMYLPNDTIVKYGSVGDSLYYISCGTVTVMNSRDEQICRLEKGSYFGESTLVIENEKRIITVRALEICELAVIKRSDFLALVNPHTSLLNRLQKLALIKLEKGNKGV